MFMKFCIKAEEIWEDKCMVYVFIPLKISSVFFRDLNGIEPNSFVTVILTFETHNTKLEKKAFKKF